MAVIYTLAVILLIWVSVVAALSLVPADTDLFTATEADDYNAVKRLLDIQCYTKEVNAPSGSNNITPIFAAARGNYFRIALLLLSCGADPNVWTYSEVNDYDDKWTPLMIASQKGFIKMVHLLLSVGAKIDLQTRDGWTALMRASTEDHMFVVNALLAAQANTDIINKGGQTALIRASMKNNLQVARELMSAGADPTIKDNEGKTAEDIANDKRHTQIVQIIQGCKDIALCG